MFADAVVGLQSRSTGLGMGFLLGDELCKEEQMDVIAREHLIPKERGLAEGPTRKGDAPSILGYTTSGRLASGLSGASSLLVPSGTVSWSSVVPLPIGL